MRVRSLHQGDRNIRRCLHEKEALRNDNEVTDSEKVRVGDSTGNVADLALMVSRVTVSGIGDPNHEFCQFPLAPRPLNKASGDKSPDRPKTRFALVQPVIPNKLGTWLGLLFVVSSLSVGGSIPAGASSTSASSLKCGSDQLSVVWRGTTGGLAGTFGDLFWIRNRGASPCVISGFPRIAIYEKGKKLHLKTHDLDGHRGNDQMGVARGRRIPTIRLLPGRLASFWVFGNDVAQKCIDGGEMTVSIRSLVGSASIPVPQGFQSWIFCGGGAEVDPMVPGVSGSDPPRPLSSEIMR